MGGFFCCQNKQKRERFFVKMTQKKIFTYSTLNE